MGKKYCEKAMSCDEDPERSVGGGVTHRGTRSAIVGLSQEVTSPIWDTYNLGLLRDKAKPFFLPFANAISIKNYDQQLEDIYDGLSKLEIYSLSTEEQISRLENNFRYMECKNSLSIISTINLYNNNRKLVKKIKNLKNEIKNFCKV